MGKLIQTLVPLVLVLVLVLANTVQSQTVEPLAFAYNFGLGYRPTDLTYQGAAHFASDSTNLQLTHVEPSGAASMNSVGRVLHANPFPFGSAGADFRTNLRFIIKPSSGGDAPPAEGLTFFMAPVGSQIPESSFGENLGIFGWIGTAPNLFAVEFDIFSSEDWADVSGPHVGLDFESRVSDVAAVIPDGLVGQEVSAQIRYVAATTTISVNVYAGGKRTQMSKIFDLGSILENRIQVGLSASTGSFVARHEIIYWDFFFNATSAAASIRQVV